MNRTLDNGIERRRTRQLALQTVLIGGGAPISVQSMTTTRNRDVRATLEQIEELAEAQCDIVRVAVPEMADAEALETLAAGALFDVLDMSGGWAWGQFGDDGPVGYIALAELEACAQ